MNVRNLFLLTPLAFAFSGCGEVTSAKYMDRNDANNRGAIGESKWLPAWLPEDAVGIQEAHDVDTNESWLVFRPNSGYLKLPENCRQAHNFDESNERLIRRFPKFAQDAWARSSRRSGDFFLCPEGSAQRWVMHDKELNLVYSRVKF
jgi:hypothetical protein